MERFHFTFLLLLTHITHGHKLHFSATMGSESDHDPPKLSLYSLPSKRNEPLGLLTPPIHTLASIPFQWEEAPGKPRPCCYNNNNKPKASRCLDLPPRLLYEAKVNNFPSPTTVLDGPDSTEIFGRTGSGKNRLLLRSGKWGSFRKKHSSFQASGSVSVSSSSPGSSDDQFSVATTKAKMGRIKRRSSFFSSSQSRSHLLTSIYEGFKQVVPWKRSTKRT